MHGIWNKNISFKVKIIIHLCNFSNYKKKKILPIQIFLCEFQEASGYRFLFRCEVGIQIYPSFFFQIFYTELRVRDCRTVILHPRCFTLAGKPGAVVILKRSKAKIEHCQE